MYKKYVLALVFFNLVMILAAVNVAELKINHILTTPAFKISMEIALAPEVQTNHDRISETVSSGQRIIAYCLLQGPETLVLSDEDYEVLLRIVEAEAGGEDIEGKMMVAGVVLNRVNDKDFPNTVKEVVFQRENGTAQFSPAYSGRYNRVVVSEDTIEAVNRVLAGEDLSEGALFFVSRRYATSNKVRWFDEHLTFLFSHGGHEFFH